MDLTPDRVLGDCEVGPCPKPKGGEAATEMSAPRLIRTPTCTGPKRVPTRVRIEARSGKEPAVKGHISTEGGRQGGGKEAGVK